MGKTGQTKRTRSRRPQAPPPNGAAAAEAEASRSPVSLEVLSRQQRVKPFQGVEDFAGAWPADFDPDEFLACLGTEREERRRTADLRRTAGNGEGRP